MSCSSLSNVSSGCNLHSRKVLRLKELQENEKGTILAAIMADSSTLFDGVGGLEKQATMKDAKKTHKDRLLEIEKEMEMQSKQETLLSRLAAQTLEK